MRSITMSRVLLSGALALGALGAVLGFTPGLATADAAPSVSEFAGTYDSSGWPAPIKVSNRGQITSSYSSGGFKGSMSGSISADGTYSITASQGYFEHGPRDHGWDRWSYQYAGTMSLDADGNIVATGGTGGSFVWLVQ